MQIGEIGGRHHAPMALEKTNGRMRPQIARSTQMPCGVIVKHTDRDGGTTDGHGFFRMRKVVSMRARLRHVPKGQKFIAQGVASLALGYGGHWAFSPHGICVDLWHLWENKSSSLFLSALCAYLSPTDLSDLHRCSFTPHAKKSRSVAPVAHQKPSSRQWSKSK